MEHSTEGKCCNTSCGNLFWWITLVVAVLAVPGFGVVVAAAAPVEGIGSIVVFILACWLCTFLGMKLMSNPKMHEKMGKK